MTAAFWCLHTGHNPLARRWDRAEGALLLGVVVLSLVVLPIAAAIGYGTFTRLVQVSHYEMDTHRETTAVTLADAPPESYTSRGMASGVKVDVPATWRLPGGGERTGTVPVDHGTAAGTSEPIWLDQAGNPTHAPSSSGDAIVAGVLTGVLIWFFGSCLLGGLYWGVHLLLDRARYAEWARDWERIDRYGE